MTTSTKMIVEQIILKLLLKLPLLMFTLIGVTPSLKSKLKFIPLFKY